MKKLFLVFLILSLVSTLVFAKGGHENTSDGTDNTVIETPPDFIEPPGPPDPNSEDFVGIVGSDGSEVSISDGTRLVYFSYSHNGMYSESCYRYTFEDPQGLVELEKIVEECNVRKWNGFSKTARGVLDGEGFSLYLKYSDGTTVSASGSNAFPKGYGDFELKLQGYIVANGYLPDKDEWSDSEYIVGRDNLVRKWSTDYSFDIGDTYFNNGVDMYLMDDGTLFLATYSYEGEGKTTWGTDRSKCFKCVDQYYFGTWDADDDRLQLSIPELGFEYSTQYRIEKARYGTALYFQMGTFYPNWLEDMGTFEASTDKNALLGVWEGHYGSDWDSYADSSGAWYHVYVEGYVWAFDKDHCHVISTKNDGIPDYVEACDYTYENGVLTEYAPDGDVYAYKTRVIGDHLLLSEDDGESYFIYERAQKDYSIDASLEALHGSWVNVNEGGKTVLTFADDSFTIERTRGGETSKETVPFKFHYGSLELAEVFEPFVVMDGKLLYYITDYTPDADRNICFTFVFDRI